MDRNVGAGACPRPGCAQAAVLYHSAHCVECGVKPNSLGLRGFHVGVVHGVLKGRLAVGALVAHVAVELDLGPCSEKQRDKQMALQEEKKEKRKRKYNVF